ncbi:SMI1/KNR4 family protein SUKH-1 [Streptomyces sp. 840.1]|uniref:SMI1/KNR4 family protein n=1 Tax=Streptomyces sp. 840.1 TaxID=2485152 RepID=UPI000F4A472C|nr:SMI1/KNR4 family protein [Streptomyces sp. 840.1]ROQ59409.1 SMI1/KNR4 family protein SUKH-1 [Streptomyces sp. 840.1]
MNDMDDLVRSVAVRAASDNASLPAPLDDARIAEAEAELGFALHPLLVRLYREVADGGFGPDYRLLPLSGPDCGVTGEYLTLRAAAAAAEHSDWPEGVVPILTWGCGMYAGVDCRSEDGQVLLFDPNPYGGGSWERCWFLDSAGLAGWLETWLAGAGWFEEDAHERDDVAEPEPWDEAGSRLSAGV